MSYQVREVKSQEGFLVLQPTEQLNNLDLIFRFSELGKQGNFLGYIRAYWEEAGVQGLTWASEFFPFRSNEPVKVIFGSAEIPYRLHIELKRVVTRYHWTIYERIESGLVAWQPEWSILSTSLISSGDFAEFKATIVAVESTDFVGGVGILPEGFRPVRQITYTNLDGDKFGTFTILSSGQIIVLSGSPPYKLDIIFRIK
ncbi:hypothetical protein [Coleofasciculus sp. F4-SAH-05]|uniref:hypothetical protein n=1 Tax=Coleofasciculus sp. F4-SAH-05 TaxID=3069525 RepID=UPI0032F3D535